MKIRNPLFQICPLRGLTKLPAEACWTVSYPAVLHDISSTNKKLGWHVQNRLAKNSSTGKDPLFSDLRPPLDVFHKAERRRSSRRVGNSDASPERRASLQEVFPNE